MKEAIIAEVRHAHFNKKFCTFIEHILIDLLHWRREKIPFVLLSHVNTGKSDDDRHFPLLRKQGLSLAVRTREASFLTYDLTPEGAWHS